MLKYSKKLEIQIFDSLYEKSKKTKLNKYSYYFTKLIPQWILEETDELLISYLKQLTHIYLSYKEQNAYVYETDINKTDLLLIEVFYSFGLDKYLQRKVDKKKLQYFKSLVKAFLKIRKHRGEKKALSIFFSFLGLKIKKIRKYVGSVYSNNIYVEEDKLKENPNMSIREFYDKYPPSSVFDIILQEIRNDTTIWDSGYWFTPVPSFLSINKIIEEMSPYHSEFRGLFTELDGQDFSAFNISTTLLIVSLVFKNNYFNIETKILDYINLWDEYLSLLYSYPIFYFNYDWTNISLDDIRNIINDSLLFAKTKVITIPEITPFVYNFNVIGSPNTSYKRYTYDFNVIGSPNTSYKRYTYDFNVIGSFEKR